ncbi:glycosyltransferase family 2 protein [Sedimentibacter saalensis]|uniref:glycosyltransferase family 2 protein n=1 Tax=Sedimentibacter saalensis TaxID=130788 RepID=UPI0028978C03|nr:glycosyltransferase family 2 protein [Sedimentibacter saalensis]
MIDILLASYNGEKYIAEQIDSILNQTYKDWFLYIKDDCSTDNTLNIIRNYEKSYKDKIKVITSEIKSGSAKDNFFSMLKYSENEYIMTCDQDDVWLPDKIEITLNKMQEVEQADNNVPILVHTDLKVVDEKLNIIAESLMKMQNLDFRRDKLNNLLVQNIVTGCTVMVNRKLLNYIKLVPRQAIMHDWWMALLASALGIVYFIDTPTVLYRQHKNNDVGAKNVKSTDYILRKLRNLNSVKDTINDTYIQAAELLNAIGDEADSRNNELIKQYSLFLKINKYQRIKRIIKYQYWKNGIIRVVGQVFIC